MKPFLRWAGSKRKLLHRLAAFWEPQFERYVEPFMGSACLFFELEPEKAVLGDLNKDLVNTFVAIQEDPVAVHTELSALSRCRATFYRLREMKPVKESKAIGAARFIFLNRYCFNGLYRTNLKGEFNVPYAPHRTGSLPSEADLIRYSDCLKNAVLTSGDFSETLEGVKKNDFVYIDPPYALEKRRVFREYGPTPFCTNDLDRLSKSLATIDRKGARFVLSYAYCREALRAFSSWSVQKIFTQRNIAGFSGKRRLSGELLVTNGRAGMSHGS
jgi:DNA adenine methylase